MEKMISVAILQSNYIPWKGYFDIINSVDYFVVYDEVQFTKNDWRNRNKIKTPNGTEWISIPVRHNSISQKINETKTVSELWRKKHLRMLQTNYGKSPFFDEIFEILEPVYLEKTDVFLSQINLSFIQCICNYLHITTKILKSEDLHLEGDRSERLVNACKKLGATHYLSGPAAKSYLDESLFVKEKIKITYMDYSNYPEYPQLFPPFSHEVSILDLLFNTGPNATKYMKSFKEYEK